MELKKSKIKATSQNNNTTNHLCETFFITAIYKDHMLKFSILVQATPFSNIFEINK